MDIPSYSEYQEDKDLPQCKIKRNYSCSHCLYYTQNPRFYLAHLRDVHGERITISNCSLCLYASRHYQKLVRHMKMVHGSTNEGIPEQSRKRPLIEDFVPDCPVLPPLPTPPKWIIDIDNLSYDLKSSRKTLKDIAAIYFAENDIDDILDKMEASDVVEVVPVGDASPSIGIAARTIFGDPKHVGEGELDIGCPCGHVSKRFLDFVVHGKSCSASSEKNYKSAPLDLSIRSSKKGGGSASNPTNVIKKEQVVDKQDDSKKYQYDNLSKITHEDLSKDNLRIYKHAFEHSKKLENKPDEEKIKSEKPELNDDEVVNTPIIPKEEPRTLPSKKKVFKCPLCPFWASTASRFHVHIVGHQNKKPFKCSLCAYCSNWRWDITKHIRLRTIRSPSHKNARVLMQGENGRRNYTKYDRFITSMKISNYDADFMLKKCGEMTSNDGDSNVISSETVKENLMQRTINNKKTKLKQKQKLNSSPEKVQTPPEVVQNDNYSRSGSKQCNPRTYLILEDGDKPVYKCSKCNFRHQNRDAVLVHVKIHHQDLLNCSLVLSKSAKTTAESYEVQKMTTCEDVKSSAESVNNTEFMIVDVENDAIVSTSKKDYVNVKKPTTNPLTSPVKDSIENNDNVGDIMVNEGASGSCNANNYAPFRCWHCHQVSNWKHVIQRHCRLKHSGSIRIEAIDRSIDPKNPIYRMLNLSSNSEVLPDGIQNDRKSDIEKKTKHQNCVIDLDTELSRKMHDITLKDSKSRLNIKKAEQNRLKFKCKDCSYISTNKIQLNKHYTQKHKPSSITRKKIQILCAGENSDNSTAISDKKKNELEKCSFASSCHSPMECQEQCQDKVVINQKDSQFCKSNLIEGSSSNFAQNKGVAGATDHPKSNANSEIAMTVTDSFQKIKNSSSSESIANISLKNDSDVNRQMDKIDKEIQLKIQHNKTTSSNNKKTSSSSLPAKLGHKTILVNPKTGQIVRRN